jgi:large repetitive protein
MKTPLLPSNPLVQRVGFVMFLTIGTLASSLNAQVVRDTLPAGSGTFTVPVAVMDITVEVWGAGGGGSIGNGSQSGGGGGGYARKIITVSPGDMLPWTTGQGGLSGADGEGSSFNSGDVAAGGGTAGIDDDTPGTGGALLAGDAGFSGGDGAAAPTNQNGGGGGGSATAGADGNNGSGSTGGTGQGNGGNGGIGNNAPGAGGGFPGGGGGGKGGAAGGASGSGSNGLIVVAYSCEPPVFTTCPANIMVNVDPGVCNAEVNYTVTFTPAYAEISYEFSGATMDSGSGDGAGSEFGVGVTIVLIEAETGCGMASCTFTVTVVDNELPVILCPDNAVIACDDELDPYINNLLGLPAVSDNCADPFDLVVTYMDATAPGSCPQNINLTRTWRVTDPSNNTATCNQVLNILDTEAPTADFPDDTSVAAGAMCLYDATPMVTGQPTNIMDCDTMPMVSFNDVVGISFCGLDVITRTWTITDACGNSTTSDQVITVEDLTPPTMIGCPADVIVECDNVPDILDYVVEAVDNCSQVLAVVGDQDIVDDPDFGDFCPNYFMIINTWTTEDDCGNTATCSQTIRVRDTTIPVIDCPVNVMVECSDDLTPLGQGEATATDNCSDPEDIMISYLDSNLPGSCEDSYTIQRTWTAADECFNSATCLQTITVEDNTDPQIICPDNILIECDEDSSPTTLGVAQGSDNCDNAVSISPMDVIVPGACPDSYNIDRTWTATDNCGNTATCLQTINVLDTTPPDVTCHADETVECDNIPTAVTPVAMDNCDMVLTVDFDEDPSGLTGCNNTGTLLRTWVFTDNCGNATTCEQVITVEDTTPPTWDQVMPANQTVNCQSVPAPAMGLTYSDNCGADNQAAGFSEVSTQDPDPLQCAHYNYTITRTWTAEDECGNETVYTQTVTVQDVTIPDFTAPLLVNGNAGVLCDQENDLNNTGFPSNMTDNCVAAEGNAASGYTPGATSWTTAAGYQVSYTDNIIFPHPSGDCSLTSNNQFRRKYRVIRTFVVADVCGNTRQRTQEINVVDNLPPVWDQSMPADETAECDNIPMAPVAGMDLTATDNCDDILIYDFTENPVPGSCAGQYTLIRTWTVEDQCGFGITHTQTITVVDTQEPVLTGTLPGEDVGNVCVDAAPPAPAGSVVAAEYSDNCGMVIATLVSADTVGTDCGWTVTYTYSIEDDCGNPAADAMVVYAGSDNEPPVLSGILPGGDQGNLCLADAPLAVPANTIASLYMDNCSYAIATLVDSDIIGTDCSWTATFTYSVTDSCGNPAPDAVVEFFGGDTEPPTFTLPFNVAGNAGRQCGDEFDFSIVGFPANIMDNCADDEADGGSGYSMGNTSWTTPNGYTVSYNDVITDPHPFGECTLTENGLYFRKYRVDRTWTVTDPCGNSTTGLQQINITDQTPPTWDQPMPADATLECDNVPDLPEGGVDLFASDNCDDALELTYTEVEVITPGACPDSYTITRTWTVEDICGNSTAHTQIITVQDTETPVLAGILPGENVGNVCLVDAPMAPLEAEIAALFIDNCGAVSASLEDTDIDGDDCGWTVTYTYEVSDECGNVTTVDVVYTGADTEAPVLTGTLPGGALGNVCVADAPGAVPIGDIEAAYTDNCGDVTAALLTEVVTGDDCSWTATFTYSIVDECGNFAPNAVVVFTGGDTGAPTFTAPVFNGDAGLQCGAEDDLGITGFPTNIQDNCAPNQSTGEDGYTPVRPVG